MINNYYLYCDFIAVANILRCYRFKYWLGPFGEKDKLSKQDEEQSHDAILFFFK